MKKRSWYKNIWGNVVGYESGRRMFEFGCSPWAERWADQWCRGYSIEEAENRALTLDEPLTYERK